MGEFFDRLGEGPYYTDVVGVTYCDGGDAEDVISQEDGDVATPAFARSGAPPTDGGLIYRIVVNEGRQVKQFDGGSHEYGYVRLTGVQA